jgi:hypothetical protein
MSQAHADLDKATPKNIPTDVGAMLDSLKGGAQQLSPEDYARVGQATGRQDLIDGCMMSSGQRDPQHPSATKSSSVLSSRRPRSRL